MYNVNTIILMLQKKFRSQTRKSSNMANSKIFLNDTPILAQVKSYEILTYYVNGLKKCNLLKWQKMRLLCTGRSYEGSSGISLVEALVFKFL